MRPITNKIQASGKCGDIIVVIAGDTPAEFQDNAMAILGPDAMDSIGEAFKAALVSGAEMGVMTKAQDAVILAGMTPSATPSTPAESVTRPQTPATSTGPKSQTDKWGNEWTYEIPGAPRCAHGVRVQKKGKSQQGKAYTGWFCPTQSPFAFQNKIQRAECAVEWPSR